MKEKKETREMKVSQFELRNKTPVLAKNSGNECVLI